MQNQKIINLSNKSDTNSRHFATKKWYVIIDLNNGAYGVDQYGNNEPDNIKYKIKVLKPNLCEYADAYILVTGIIRTVGGDNITKVALKNCAPFRKCILHINDEYVEKADILDVAMPMYNLIEYSDNCSDSLAILYQFKRDEPTAADDNDNYHICILHITFAAAAAAGGANAGSTFGSKSFEYKFNLIGTRAVAGNNITNTEAQAAIAGGVLAAGRVVNNVKIAVPLKYLSNFFRSLEMLLINCKIHLELEWSKDCVLYNVVGASKFIIKDTKLYVPVVTLSKEDNKDFIEQQNKGFQRSIYWNEYLINETNQNAHANVYKIFNVDPSFQGVNRLLVMAYRYDNANINNYANRNNHQRYSLPRVDIKDYNAIIDRRNCYDNNINSDVKNIQN